MQTETMVDTKAARIRAYFKQLTARWLADEARSTRHPEGCECEWHLFDKWFETHCHACGRDAVEGCNMDMHSFWDRVRGLVRNRTRWPARYPRIAL
jgi:hypothetical protein